MMASARETAVLALVAALKTTGALVARNADQPEIVPPEGYVTVAEGEADIETFMSPLSYAVDLNMVVEVYATAVDEMARDEALDDLLVMISTTLTADRTLGGAVEFIDIGPPDFEAFEGDGAAKFATLPVMLSFTTFQSPLT